MCSLGELLCVATVTLVVNLCGLDVGVMCAWWIWLWGFRYAGYVVGKTQIWFVCRSRVGLCCWLGLVSILRCGWYACIVVYVNDGIKRAIGRYCVITSGQ